MVQLRLRSRRAAGLQCGVQERPSTLHGPNRADSTLDSAPLRGLHCFCYVCRVRCTCVCVVYCVLCVGLRVLLFLLGRPPGELLRCGSYARSSSPVLSQNRLLGRHQHQELSRMNLTNKILHHCHLGLQVPRGASSVRAPEQLLAF